MICHELMKSVTVKIHEMKSEDSRIEEFKDNQTKLTVPRGWLGGGPAMQSHIRDGAGYHPYMVQVHVHCKFINNPFLLFFFKFSSLRCTVYPFEISILFFLQLKLIKPLPHVFTYTQIVKLLCLYTSCSVP